MLSRSVEKVDVEKKLPVEYLRSPADAVATIEFSSLYKLRFSRQGPEPPFYDQTFLFPQPAFSAYFSKRAGRL